MKSVIQLVLSALLLLCLADMPYGYYQLVRFVTTFSFVYLAFCYYKENRNSVAYIFAVLAMLFQPFVKIALGRVIWNVVDVVVAIALIAMTYVDYRINHRNIVAN